MCATMGREAPTHGAATGSTATAAAAVQTAVDDDDEECESQIIHMRTYVHD